MAPKKSRPRYPRTVLRLSDLDHSKSAVLDSLTSLASRRTYEYAIEEFIAWYCSEPRLAFNRVVVTRYRIGTGSSGPGGNHYQPEASCCPPVGQRSLRLWAVEC
jgi:hypothetical protein